MDYVHQHFRKHRNMRKTQKVIPPMILKSGFKMSVQASSAHYCVPKNNEGPYTAVEVMFLTNTKIPDAFKVYGATTQEWGIGATFFHIPVEFVNYWIRINGGFAD